MRNDLQSVLRGRFKSQYLPDRLADAIAICNRDWSHFRDGSSELRPHQKWLPSELAADMRRRGLRGPARQPARSSRQSSTSPPLPSPPSLPSSSSTQPLPAMQTAEAQREQEAADALQALEPTELPPPLARKEHVAADVYGWKKGSRVVSWNLRPGKVPQEVFESRRVVPGGFVMTRPASHSSWARSNESLQGATVWIWRVLRVKLPGQHVAGFSGPQTTHVYQAHLYRPARPGDMKSSWLPAWHHVGPEFLRTEEEKASGQAPQGGRKRTLARAEGKVHASRRVPTCGYLRPANIIGGSFARTKCGKIPAYVMEYLREHFAPAIAGAGG